MSIFVVGFAVDPSNRVALIRKNRPEWQAGKFNGIGGKMEIGDKFPLSTMRREFEEETGVKVEEWELIVQMQFPEQGAEIYFSRARVTAEVMDSLHTTTDEEVVVLTFAEAMEAAVEGYTIPNLTWLLPLAVYSADAYAPMQVKARVLQDGATAKVAQA